MTDRMATVGINVSPIQLRSPGFAASVADILGSCGVGTEFPVGPEVTEGLDMDMQLEVLKCISDLPSAWR